ncbi:MAG TPA: hypothetical protein VF712_00945 [Thermoleophilaceae bacterium]
MPRALLLALVSALLALGLLAGCGDDGGKGDDKAELKEAFDRDYPPINDEFVALGNETGETIKTAKGKSNAELATKFESLATRVDGLKRRLDALEPPPEYEADTKRLSAVMGVVSGDLKEISQAATAGDAAEARTQVQELARHSVEVRTARRALARKTGAKV